MAPVIKVEHPDMGDFARACDKRVRGRASHCVWTNRSIGSLMLNVKHPEAQSVLMRLVVERADVLVQNEAGLVSITGTPETPSKAGLSMVQRWATSLQR